MRHALLIATLLAVAFMAPRVNATECPNTRFTLDIGQNQELGEEMSPVLTIGQGPAWPPATCKINVSGEGYFQQLSRVPDIAASVPENTEVGPLEFQSVTLTAPSIYTISVGCWDQWGGLLEFCPITTIDFCPSGSRHPNEGCECTDLDGDPIRLTLPRNGRPGKGQMHGSSTVLDEVTFSGPIIISLVSPDGVVFEETLPPGALLQHGNRRWQYGSATDEGVTFFQIKKRGSEEEEDLRYRIRIKWKGPMPNTGPDMLFSISFGPSCFGSGEGSWMPIVRGEVIVGWEFDLPGE